MLRKWYNIPVLDLEGNPSELDTILQQSSDNEDAAAILEQSDSDHASPDLASSDEAGVLVQSEDEAAEDTQPAKRRKYAARTSRDFTFLGKSVCSRAHQILYRISSRALQNIRQGMPAYTMNEKRVQEPKHDLLKVSMSRNPSNMQWPHIVSFFWLLYISAAEILPTKFTMPSWDSHVESDPDYCERFTSGFLQNLEKHFELAYPGQIGPGTFQGPRRYLEHSKPVDLYMQYTAYADAENIKPASLATFMRIFNRVFKHHLKFRDKAEFGQCDVCYRYKMKIKKSTSKSERLQWTRHYSSHLFSQWRDRQFYWRMRELSRQFFAQGLSLGTSKIKSLDMASSILTIIQDGMDQSKLRLPKWGYVRLPKSLEALYRPATHLAATWVHGCRLFLSLTDENVKKKSEAQMEQLARALSEILAFTGQLPLQLHCQSDNCFREAKNQYVSGFMLMMVVLRIFRSTSQGFLRKSHSHEDVDQIFGQLSRLLQGKSVTTADAMVDLLNKVTKRQGTSTTSEGSMLKTTCVAYKLDVITCWKDFVSQTGVLLRGMRHVHYLKFCERRDMGSDILDNVSEIEELKGKQYEKHPEDIFLITKRWLADTEMARVVCVMPAGVARDIRLGYHLPTGEADRRVISEGLKKNIFRYATKGQRSGTLSAESAGYLLHWVRGTLPKHPKPAAYPILDYSFAPASQREPARPGTWNTPLRRKIFDVSLVQEDQDLNESSSDEGEVDLPLALQ